MGTGRRIPILNATLLILSALTWPCFGKNSTLFCREEERDALLEFKQSLTCTPSDLLRSWEGKEDCCNWKGVGCDSRSRRVIKLELLPLSEHPSLDSELKPYSASELSPSLLKLISLSHLDLSGFQFSNYEVIPKVLGSMKQLRFLNLSRVEFSGSYYHLGNLSSLEVLDFHGYVSTIDEVQWISRLTALEYLDMSWSYVQAHNVMQVLSMLPSLSYLALSGCSLDNSHLAYARGSNTSFFPSLSHLDLSINYFRGTFPSMFQNIPSLSYLDLDLSHNQISGLIPNLTSVSSLDLSYNMISGTIPASIGSSSLEGLYLNDNLITGTIPTSLCDAGNMFELDLSRNELSGIIPECWGNRTSYTPFSIDLSSNNLFGRIPSSFGNIYYLTSLCLSDNNLHGYLPESLQNPGMLKVLDVGENNIDGEIPAWIGDMKFLESLDLSNNQLSGTIPQSISDLSMLSHLNLSNNNLSGRIPRGNQLNTLESSVYAGNPLLCGEPLPNKCPAEEVPTTPDIKNSSEGEDVDGSESVEKVIFCGITAAGFLTGFWGVFGVLVFKKKWRIAYFRFAEEIADRAYVAVVVKVAQLKRRMRST